MPKKGIHCHPVAIKSIILGNIITCDKSAAKSNHRHCLANCDMLYCVPAVTDIDNINTSNTAIPMIASVAIPLSN